MTNVVCITLYNIKYIYIVLSYCNLGLYNISTRKNISSLEKCWINQFIYFVILEAGACIICMKYTFRLFDNYCHARNEWSRVGWSRKMPLFQISLRKNVYCSKVALKQFQIPLENLSSPLLEIHTCVKRRPIQKSSLDIINMFDFHTNIFSHTWIVVIIVVIVIIISANTGHHRWCTVVGVLPPRPMVARVKSRSSTVVNGEPDLFASI